MKGWHNDNYRHSLAARGYRLSMKYDISKIKPSMSLPVPNYNIDLNPTERHLRRIAKEDMRNDARLGKEVLTDRSFRQMIENLDRKQHMRDSINKHFEELSRMPGDKLLDKFQEDWGRGMTDEQLDNKYVDKFPSSYENIRRSSRSDVGRLKELVIYRNIMAKIEAKKAYNEQMEEEERELALRRL